MLDELEKRRCALDEVLGALQGKLEPVLKQADSCTASNDPSEKQPESELHRIIDLHLDRLASMRHTIESIIDRLDIPI